MTEQYIVRELKQDIKLLIKKVNELENKLEEAHPTQKDSPEYRKLVGEIEERYQDSR